MPRLTITTVLPGKPREVFDALTKPDAIRSWSGQSASVSKTVGGKFRMFDSWVSGHVLAYRPRKLLMYTWRVEDWPAKTPPSIVRYELSSSAKGTKVRIVHHGLPSTSERDSHKQGWKDYVLDPVKEYLSRRK